MNLEHGIILSLSLGITFFIVVVGKYDEVFEEFIDKYQAGSGRYGNFAGLVFTWTFILLHILRTYIKKVAKRLFLKGADQTKDIIPLWLHTILFLITITMILMVIIEKRFLIVLFLLSVVLVCLVAGLMLFAKIKSLKRKSFEQDLQLGGKNSHEK